MRYTYAIVYRWLIVKFETLAGVVVYVATLSALAANAFADLVRHVLFPSASVSRKTFRLVHACGLPWVLLSWLTMCVVHVVRYTHRFPEFGT
jgi:hypothetical protein